MGLEISKLGHAASEFDMENPFKLRPGSEIGYADLHEIRTGVICETDKRGQPQPGGASPLEIVLDATDGFIPLWQQGTTLHWRFNGPSLASQVNPSRMMAAVERLLGEALLLWGDAVPVRFKRDEDVWDFEIAVRPTDHCTPKGCTLARAFFPDGGRHELVIFPMMFDQIRDEQVETMAHELGHIFGLRHFFALVSETAWPAVVFGDHAPFSIMNYGADSRMTDTDRNDLKTLYRLAWSGAITQINGTPIRLVKPYHAAGVPAALQMA